MSNSNDADYYAARDRLYAELALWPRGAYCSSLAARVGMSSHEARAKLMSLRKDGLAHYDSVRQLWWAVPRPEGGRE
jgi:hypothetical protein